VRATTGRDIVAFLFSSNALRLHPAVVLPAPEAAKLGAPRRTARLAAVYRPLDPAAVLAGNRARSTRRGGAHGLRQLERDAPALLALTRAAKVPADAVVVVGATDLERGWCGTGRLAGFVPAGRFFAA
jgi:hypothetical protein